MTENSSQSLVLKVNGAEIGIDEYDDLIDVRVSSSLRSADRLSMRLRDPYFELLDDDRFPYDGQVQVSLPNDSGSMVEVFAGRVVGLDVEQGGSDRHELVVVALDERQLLARSGEVRTFIEQTVSEIVRTVVRGAGLEASIGSFTTTFANLVQSGSDFEFLNRLAQWADAQWWIDDRVVQFQPVPKGAASTLTWGENLMSFSTRSSTAGRPGEVTVRAWDEATQAALIARAGASDSKDLGTDASIATDANRVAAGSRVIGTSPFSDLKEGNQLAASLMNTSTSGLVSLQGECLGEPGLRAGSSLSLAGVGTRLAGSWTTTDVEHVIGADHPYTTRFVCGGREGTSLLDLVGAGREDIGPTRQMEPAIGTVSNTKDPDHRGRVRVRFATLGDDVESSWARVAGLGAGNDRGLLVVPQVDDEVLVVFEHGSWRRPVVIAGLWSTPNAPPKQKDIIDDGNPDKAILLRTIGGHEVELHEGSGADSFIRLTLASRTTALTLAGDFVTLETDQPLSLTSTKDISIESSGGDVAIKANNITCDAKQNMSVKGLQVSVDARSTLELKAAASADLKANGPLNVQSSAITSVKGSLLKLN